MRWNALSTLFVTNVLLALALASLWFTPQAQPRSAPWQPPAPLVPEAPQALPLVAAPPDAGQQQAILERPLFAPDRRPPPPPPPPSAKPPPDPLANMQLTGVLQGDFNGVLARVDGQSRRIRVDETIGSWKLVSVNGRKATFTRDGNERTLEMAYARLSAPLPSAPTAAAGNAGIGQSTASSAAPEAASGLSVSQIQAQRRQEDQRERLRRRNELRARAGLPPIPEPSTP